MSKVQEAYNTWLKAYTAWLYAETGEGIERERERAAFKQYKNLSYTMLVWRKECDEGGEG